jgi:type IV pilus assembly protein PilM
MIPDIAIEIDAGQVAAARLTWRGADATVTAHAIESFAPGIVTPALATANISDVPAVARAVAQALSRLGVRARRVALVVPDTVAKVSLIRFETVPPKLNDLQELVRWQIKKTAPFPLEDAVVTFTPGARLADGGQEFVVAVARRDNVAQYEQVCTLAGVHAGLVDLATFSIVNGVLASRALPAGDWLLVHVTSSYTTLTVIRDGNVLLFRNRVDDAEGTLADLVHQTSMYYEDRLQGAGFSRVMLAGGAAGLGGAGALRQNLEQRLGLTVEAVDPRAAAALVDRINASPELLDTLAPLVGILVRERKAA